MEVADNQDIQHLLVDAYAADKSPHYESNGSSKQHDAEQMQVLDAFDHKPSLLQRRRVSVNWLLVDEPHVVETTMSALDVNVSGELRWTVVVQAITVDLACRVNAVAELMLHKNDADNCSLTFRLADDCQCSNVLVILIFDAVLVSLLPIPFRSKKFCCVMNGSWCCGGYSLRWAYEVVST